MLLTALSALLFATVPPPVERGQDGAAADGQIVSQATTRKKQIVAIVPDRTTGRDWGLRYLREAVDDFNRAEPDAVFCVGDLVQGYTRDHARMERERKDFLDIVGNLTMPFYPTPGNHDVVSGERSTSDRRFADEYRTLFGPLYYAVELEFASFVILNTEDGEGRIAPGFSDAQLSWLDDTLERLALRNRPMILLFHRPLWDHAATRWSERVQPILVKHGVDYVIAGHYHALQSLPPRDGIPYLLLGTCGGANDQHPLAGHLQHITFVVIDENGTIEPYHQIAGCTLPVDWITKEDQDRAYKLKGSRDAVTLRGAVVDPLGKPSASTIDVVLKNPLDRDVEFRMYPTAAPEPLRVVDRVDGSEIERVWTSRTPIDIANAWTTDFASPFRLEFPLEPITLAAGESRTVKISVTCPAQVAPPLPAPFDVVATYSDSKGRRVPIVLRQRVPLARTVLLAPSIASATEFPVAVWTWSEYDTSEANASVRVAHVAAPELFEIDIAVPDLTFSGDAKSENSRQTLDDPLGDAVRVVLGEGPEAREYLVTFDEQSMSPLVRTLSPDRKSLVPAEAVRATLVRAERMWHLSLIVGAGALPEGARLDGLPINIGVADNDETYHTQWRWVAPRSLPARLKPTK